MRLLPEEHHREAHAEDQSRENKRRCSSFDAPRTFRRCHPSTSMNYRLAHGAIWMVGIPPALKSASGDEDCETKKQSCNIEILAMSALPERACQPP